MSPRPIPPPPGVTRGRFAVLAANTRKRNQWDRLRGSHGQAMSRCYEELSANPCLCIRPGSARHHQLKGKKFQQGAGPFWEYEVGGGARVRYKRGTKGEAVVVYAGPAPADTH